MGPARSLGIVSKSEQPRIKWGPAFSRPVRAESPDPLGGGEVYLHTDCGIRPLGMFVVLISSNIDTAAAGRLIENIRGGYKWNGE